MIIKTAAPISLDDLKKHFTDKTISYVIDYASSKLQGAKLLTYVSNLDLPIDIEFDPASAEGKELIKAYLTSTFLVNVPSLEIATINYLLNYRFEETPDSFVVENKDLFDLWSRLLDSATVYNMYIVNDESLKEFARQLPEEKFETMVGINFVQLFKHEGFYTFYQKINQDNLKFMPQVFDDYIFKGKNLYNFWATDKNPMFLLTWGIAAGVITGSDYAQARGASLAEITNVAPI